MFGYEKCYDPLKFERALIEEKEAVTSTSMKAVL